MVFPEVLIINPLSLVFIISFNEFVGIKPPDDIRERVKFKPLNNNTKLCSVQSLNNNYIATII